METVLEESTDTPTQTRCPNRRKKRDRHFVCESCTQCACAHPGMRIKWDNRDRLLCVRCRGKADQ